MIVRPKQFTSINDALAQVGYELLTDGEPVYVQNAIGDKVFTRELADWCIVFAPEHNNICTLPERKFPVKGAQAEFLWYMTGNPDANIVAKFLPNWLNYANEDGIVNSNYGVYWKQYIPSVIDELKRDKSSRRAVMNIYHAGNAPFGKDTPCTLSLQFLIRTDKEGHDSLCMICNMRSNDIWYGLSIDQFCNDLLHQLVHHSLLETYPELRLGWYSHHAGSMHVYMSESSGNATITNKTLGDMFMHQLSNPDKGQRLVLPNDMTFENFWDKATSEVFDAKRLEYFKSIMTKDYNGQLH
jgi:thymidylate synthase